MEIIDESGPKKLKLSAVQGLRNGSNVRYHFHVYVKGSMGLTNLACGSFIPWSGLNKTEYIWEVIQAEVHIK